VNRPIDLSQVPRHLHKHPEILRLSEAARISLDNPEFVDAVCIHEAAHVRYYLRAGIEEFDYLGARITYDSGEFCLLMAGIQAKSEAIRIGPGVVVTELVTLMAAVSVAGGVATRVLATVPDVGDEADKQVFKRFCDNLGISEAVRLQYWEIIETSVMRELQSEELQQTIRAKAREIRPLLGL
jgi:hypothetical protein